MKHAVYVAILIYKLPVLRPDISILYHRSQEQNMYYFLLIPRNWSLLR